jgi:hypothetical protein
MLAGMLAGMHAAKHGSRFQYSMVRSRRQGARG